MKYLTLLVCLLLTGPVLAEEKKVKQVVWNLDNLEEIGGHKVTMKGEPKVIETTKGKAIEFDGVDDGIWLEVHPLAGLEQFTVEVIFQPYPNGLREQRFFMMQEANTTRRVMFETRLVDDDKWFLDTFIQSGDNNHTQLAKDFVHPLGPWQHAAIVMDGKTFTHYVNGKKELSTPIDWIPQEPGRTSLGVRMNEIWWYRGVILKARFTHGILKPEEFWKP